MRTRHPSALYESTKGAIPFCRAKKNRLAAASERSKYCYRVHFSQKAVKSGSTTDVHNRELIYR